MKVIMVGFLRNVEQINKRAVLFNMQYFHSLMTHRQKPCAYWLMYRSLADISVISFYWIIKNNKNKNKKLENQKLKVLQTLFFIFFLECLNVNNIIKIKIKFLCVLSFGLKMESQYHQQSDKFVFFLTFISLSFVTQLHHSFVTMNFMHVYKCI